MIDLSRASESWGRAELKPLAELSTSVVFRTTLIPVMLPEVWGARRAQFRKSPVVHHAIQRC